MKMSNWFLRAAALACLLATATQSAATPPKVWDSAEIHIAVEGTSTLHAWKVESRSATGALRLTAEGRGEGTLVVPARSLSGGPSGLNDRMYAALQAAKFSTIAFAATDVILLDVDRAVGAQKERSVRGKLTIAGTTREIVVPCRVSLAEAGRLVLEADLELKMSEFGVKPPTFMGVVRTGDAVMVRIRWTLRPDPTAATAGV